VKRISLLDPKIAVPVALAAATVAAAAGNRLRPRTTSAGDVSAAVAVAAMPTTPAGVLDRLPDPGGATAAAREVARWRDAARKTSEKPVIWVNLGDALMQRARENGDARYYDYADSTYRQALALDPNSETAMVGLAWACGGRHRFDQSVEWAKRAIAFKPKDSAPYGLIGDAQVEQGDYDGAFDSYQKMLDIRPDISSYSRGARLLYITGDVRKALWLMEKAIKAGGPYNENTLWCRAQMGEMLWSQGAILAADQVLMTALKAAPNDCQILTAMGHVKESKGDVVGAVDCYKKAIAVAPRHAALASLGDLYLSLGKKAEADVLFRQVEAANARLPQQDGQDQFTMALFYADHDRYLDTALQIVQSKPAMKNPVDQDTAAWVYFKNGRMEEAKRWIDTALKKSSNDAARLYHAGMIYARLGDRRRAEMYLYRAMSLNPHFNPVQIRVASATMKDLASRPASEGPNPFARAKTALR
jgi:tetratricopeptide (TPR) repeat protein